MIVPRKTKWIMDNESIKLWDECTCWKDNYMIAHKWTSRREIKTIFLSEPSQVNKQIPRVNLSDNDSIMMFEWARHENIYIFLSEPLLEIITEKKSEPYR